MSLRDTRRGTFVIVSLQNGVGNVAVLRARLHGRKVLGGGMNAVWRDLPAEAVSSLDLGRHRGRTGRRRDRRKPFGAELNMRPTDNIEERHAVKLTDRQPQ